MGNEKPESWSSSRQESKFVLRLIFYYIKQKEFRMFMTSNFNCQYMVNNKPLINDCVVYLYSIPRTSTSLVISLLSPEFLLYSPKK